MILYIIIGAVASVVVLVIVYFTVDLYLYKKAGDLFVKSLDFYERSTILSKAGRIEEAYELVEVANTYQEEADRIYNKADRWHAGKFKEV